MNVELITTPGATNANSYCTLLEAEDYLKTNLYTNAWDLAITINKNKALTMATRLLDELYDWYGNRATKEQVLEWPRFGVLDKWGAYIDKTIIPQFLKNATAEFAKNLLTEDTTSPPDTAGFKRIKVGPLELVIDKGDRKDIVPSSVDSIVSYYCERKYAKGIVDTFRT